MQDYHRLQDFKIDSAGSALQNVVYLCLYLCQGNTLSKKSSWAHAIGGF